MALNILHFFYKRFTGFYVLISSQILGRGSLTGHVRSARSERVSLGWKMENTKIKRNI